MEPASVAKIGSDAGASGKTPRLPDIPPTEDEGGRDKEKGKPGGSAPATKARSPTPPPQHPEDDFAALTRRFEALKKR